MASKRAFMSLWLAHMLAPGEQIVADARAASGPGPGWDLPALLLVLAAAYAGWRDLFGSGLPAALGFLVPLGSFASLWLVAFERARKPLHLLVTDRQVILVRMNRRGEPARVLACLPLASVTLQTGRSFYLRTVVIAAADGGPIRVGGKDRTRLRLIVIGRRASYESVLDTVRAAGGSVDLPLTPRCAVPAAPA